MQEQGGSVFKGLLTVVAIYAVLAIIILLIVR